MRNAGKPSSIPKLIGGSTTIRAELVGINTATAEGITVRGKSPITGLCRRLIEAGHDPGRSLEAFRGDVVCIRVRSIGEAAKLVARENRRNGPHFAKWLPRDPDGRGSHRGSSPVPQNREALPRQPAARKISQRGDLLANWS